LWLDSFGLNIDFTTYFYYLLVELKVFIEKHSVDWSGRHEDSCGRTGLGRPHRCVAPRRLHGPPAESEAPGAQINDPTYL
ncbi:MAG: hypothetical protein ACJ8MO_12040, partial [Bacillus sp. (in: firmicutes)]